MQLKMKRTHTPNNPIGQRLKAEMIKRGITSIELSKRADVKTSFIYDIISGKSANPSTVKLARVAYVLGIDLTYLVGGIHTEAIPSNTTDEYVSIPRIMVDVSQAGSAVIAVEHEAECYHFRKSWIKERLSTTHGDLRMLYVRDDSMEPTLCHNDIVLIDTNKKKPSPPGVFILFDGYGLIAKRLEYTSDQKRVRIISDNAQYSTYERSIEDTFIIGRVVWFAREI
jgi:phage repressor protein C with HTH and peptisase S24 domain